MDELTELKSLQFKLQNFAKDRDWEKFHNPKNLVMALSGEVGELVEIFQWLTLEESNNLSSKQKTQLRDEISDVFLYLLRLADITDIDLISAAHLKIKKNSENYPIEKSYGISRKYNEL